MWHPVTNLVTDLRSRTFCHSMFVSVNIHERGEGVGRREGDECRDKDGDGG